MICTRAQERASFTAPSSMLHQIELTFILLTHLESFFAPNVVCPVDPHSTFRNVFVRKLGFSYLTLAEARYVDKAGDDQSRSDVDQ